MADSPDSQSNNPSSSAPQPDQLPPPPPLQQQHQQQQQQQQQQAPLSSPFPSFPSFRAAQPQFSAVPSYMVQPPGVVGSAMNGGGAPAMAPPQMMMQYQQQPNNPAGAMRHYAPMPNGYAPQGAMNHPGVPRYTSPYMPMLRPAFAPRPLGAIGMPPGVSRPLVPGARPMVPTIIRPAVIPIITPGEKPQTTVYVGKISSSVENDFMLNLLQICGLVKGWKRAEDPTTGTPKGFGFCEFASAEGVLRALRLLNKFNIDGQELMLNVNQGTKEYLERYVEKKTEISKKLKAEEDGNASSAENNESAKASAEELKKDDNQSENKETQHNANFGIVTDEDREADRVASEKIASKIEERLKSRPLPPPPPLPPAADHPGNSNSDLPVRSSYAEMDVDTDAPKDKTDDETSDKPSEQDRAETSSPDRNRRNDRKSRDRERDLKRDKEREVDRYEKEADRERIRKERDQRRKIEDAEREYGERIKEWEYRESKREKARQYEKEREKERERKRKREILEEEEEEDTRKRGRRSERGERRKRTLWERDEDLADRQREEEEIAEAKKKAEEELKKQEQQQNDALKLLSSRVSNGSEKTIFTEEVDSEGKDKNLPQDYEDVSNDHENHIGNGTADDSIITSVTSANAPAKKLGFGLVGSGKKTAVPSVFHEEDDDEAEKDKKMRPLVPIDYSTEELQAVQPTVSGEPPSNLAAAAEFAKRISNANSKEEKHDQDRERSRRSYDRSSQRDRDRNDEDANRTKDDKKNNRDRERGLEKAKTPDNKKLLDAKQLIDMIPKTKEELFSYEINWTVYDKHELHERMRPWISKKILEFLGEEEPTLVNYIVSSTQEHVQATQMLEQLQSILDEEAEMFVLKMWRMLIFEVKKVETGLSLRPKT